MLELAPVDLRLAISNQPETVSARLWIGARPLRLGDQLDDLCQPDPRASREAALRLVKVYQG